MVSGALRRHLDSRTLGESPTDDPIPLSRFINLNVRLSPLALVLEGVQVTKDKEGNSSNIDLKVARVAKVPGAVRRSIEVGDGVNVQILALLSIGGVSLRPRQMCSVHHNSRRSNLKESEFIVSNHFRTRTSLLCGELESACLQQPQKGAITIQQIKTLVLLDGRALAVVVSAPNIARTGLQATVARDGLKFWQIGRRRTFELTI